MRLLFFPEKVTILIMTYKEAGQVGPWVDVLPVAVDNRALQQGDILQVNATGAVPQEA